MTNLKGKVPKTVLATLIVISACFAGSGPALAHDAANESHRFEQHLEQLAATSTEAAENLARFRALTPDQQAMIEQGIADGTFAEELEANAGALAHDHDSMTTTRLDRSVTTNRAYPTAKKWNTTTVSWFSQTIFGVTITKLTQRYTVEVNGQRVTASKSCTSNVVNFNFAVAIDSSNSHWREGNYGVCETTWNGYIAFKGFGIRLDKIQHLKVDGNGDTIDRWLINA